MDESVMLAQHCEVGKPVQFEGRGKSVTISAIFEMFDDGVKPWCRI
jgi:hypothetical protein